MTRAGQPPLPPNPGYGPPYGSGYGPGFGPPQPPPRPKRTLRKVLFILLGVLVALVVVVMLVPRAAAPTRNATDGTATTAGILSAIDLKAGDCYNGKQLPPQPGSSQSISTVEVVPCTAAHTAQVVDKVGYQAADSLADVRETRSGPDCDKMFKSKLREAVLGDPKLELGLIAPRDQTTWAKHPAIACIVSHPSSTTSALK